MASAQPGFPQASGPHANVALGSTRVLTVLIVLPADSDGHVSIHPSIPEQGSTKVDELGRLQEAPLGYCSCARWRYAFYCVYG